MKNFKSKLLSLLLIVFILPSSFTMADGSLREQVCRYMKNMATVEWISPCDMTYWNEALGVMFKKDTIYRGIPYSQSNRTTDYETFCSNLSDDLHYIGPTDNKSYLGNDCSSAVFMAWQQANKDMPILSTINLIPVFSELTTFVGEYTIFPAESTLECNQFNGFDVISKAYDQLKPGDALLSRSRASGHVMLVNAVDLENQIVYIIDQSGVKGEETLISENSSWRVDYPFSYNYLFNRGFMPITIPALCEND